MQRTFQLYFIVVALFVWKDYYCILPGVIEFTLHGDTIHQHHRNKSIFINFHEFKNGILDKNDNGKDNFCLLYRS